MEDLLKRDPVLRRISDDNKKALLRFNEFSLRFTPWFKENLAKIRGKLRGLRIAEDINDVKSELTCAARPRTNSLLRRSYARGPEPREFPPAFGHMRPACRNGIGV